MAKNFSTYRPNQFPQEVTVDAVTANTMLRVDLPPWTRQVIITPRTNAAYLVEPDGGADGVVAPAGANTTTLTANDARLKVFRTTEARPDYENWPPSLYLASASVGTVIEIEVEP